MFIKDGIAYASSTPQGIRAIDARVVNNLSMLVTFSNGETRLFDASDLLAMPAFSPLSDEETFESFSIDHGVACWMDGKIDIAPEAIYEGSYEYDGGQLQVA